jgi:outer membrane lipase/esterase
MGPPGLPTGNNFAISGARTGVLGTAGLPIGLLSQYGLFNGISPVPALIPAPAPRAVDPTGLYVIWGGVNDIRDFAGAPPVDPVAALQGSVANVAFLAQQLALGGARSFLIPHAPNSSVVPEVAGDPAAAALRAAFTATFNGFLDAALGQLALAFPTAHFDTFDIDPLYAAVAADAATGGHVYGFTNVTTPCLPGFGAPPSDCDKALFSDRLHPTTRAQRFVAVVGAQAVVPEPATVALVASGLALLAVGARRTRRG